VHVRVAGSHRRGQRVTDTPVNLAKALLDAAIDTSAAEQAVVDLIYKVLPFWKVLFPARRSWMWTPAARIDIWNATGSEAAVRALLAAGFTSVMIHNHRAERFLICECKLMTEHNIVDPRGL
jgi:hypothetical protein